MSEDDKPNLDPELHERAKRLNKNIEQLAKALFAITGADALTVSATYTIVTQREGQEEPEANKVLCFGTMSSDRETWERHTHSLRVVAKKLLEEPDAGPPKHDTPDPSVN